jgi:hypothetical protein
MASTHLLKDDIGVVVSLRDVLKLLVFGEANNIKQTRDIEFGVLDQPPVSLTNDGVWAVIVRITEVNPLRLKSIVDCRMINGLNDSFGTEDFSLEYLCALFSHFSNVISNAVKDYESQLLVISAMAGDKDAIAKGTMSAFDQIIDEFDEHINHLSEVVGSIHQQIVLLEKRHDADIEKVQRLKEAHMRLHNALAVAKTESFPGIAGGFLDIRDAFADVLEMQ